MIPLLWIGMGLLLSYAELPWVSIDETISTTEVHTKAYASEGEGMGQGGVPVQQTHTSQAVSITTRTTTTAITPLSEAVITKALVNHQALRVTVVGKGEITSGREYLSEVKRTFTLTTTYPQLQLFLEGAEILEENPPRVKLSIALKATQAFRLANMRSNFAMTEESIGAGKVVYELPAIKGRYTLEIPQP